MPYIKQEDRERIVKANGRLVNTDGPQNSGELNFAITFLCDRYIKNRGLSYQAINDCLGAMAGASAELYRRLAVPYEDQKIEQNGDVYNRYGYKFVPSKFQGVNEIVPISES